MCNKGQKNKKRIIERTKAGFSLAEVMITLVVIGVVAACALPMVYEKTERYELVHMLKKAESILTQSIYKISYRSGYSIGDYDYFEDEDFLDEFAKIANIVKKCNTTTECFGNTSELYVQLDQTPLPEVTGKAVATADGMLISYAGTPSNVYGLSEEDKNKTLGRIMVDINGKKRPNKVGLDTFLFYIVKDKGLVPAGSNENVDCDRNQAGFSCTARVLSEQAINY